MNWLARRLIPDRALRLRHIWCVAGSREGALAVRINKGPWQYVDPANPPTWVANHFAPDA